MKNECMIKVVFGVAVAVLTLVGCGDDSSSSPSGKTAEYATLEEAGDCAPSRYGETIFVTREGEFYFCGGKRWTLVDDGEDGGSSASGGKHGDSSSSSDDEFDPAAFDTIPIVSVKNMTIAGFAQKGPFASGSNVTVRELDGRTLAQTGKSFTGQTTNGSGAFSVSGVTLASQYAQLEVNGFYQNEATGQNSTAAITLNALVDLSKSENGNINVLTHLEAPRVRHLVATGMNVPAAKKQAEKEILRAFGVTENISNAEELDIFSTGEGDATLLAISVLMQGDLSEANLSARLANFASDLEKDGKWDDEVTKAAMADWASASKLADISANVKAMSANNKASAFEQVVKNFWWSVYGLGSCGGDNGGETKMVDNVNSRNNDSAYVCEDGIWRQLTKIETIVGAGCTAHNIGEEKLVGGYMLCSSSGVWSAGRTVSGTMTDTRDRNRQYATIGIGAQMWMAENLNYDYKVNGISYGNYCYKNSADSCAKYGKLYTWGAAMDSATTGCGSLKKCAADTGRVQGVCPNGWHLPDTAEWSALFDAVGGQSVAGTALKSTSGWYNNGNGTDAFGFSVLPFGREYWKEGNADVIVSACIWSSSVLDSKTAYQLSLYYDNAGAYLEYGDKADEPAAVRCVKD